MNLEELKVELLAMIKEAQNLSESDLETVPYSSVKVNKNKVRDFDRMAANYFELSRNHRLTDAEMSKIDYAKEVYEELVSLVQEENREYFDSLAYDITSVNKEKINHLAHLNNSLAIVNKNFERYSKIIDDLKNKQSSMDFAEWQKQLSEANEELTKFAENRSIIQKAIVGIKNEINEALKETIKKQLELIEDNYKKTFSGTNGAYSEYNGVAILASDKDEYDSLMKLFMILRDVKDSSKIVSYGDVICVNENQLEEVKALFAKTNLFSRLNEKEKEPQDNTKLIEEITAELRRLEENAKKLKEINPLSIDDVITIASNKQGILNIDIDEYENLYSALIILSKAQNSKWEKSKVWDIAYVEGNDRQALENIMRNTKFFDKYNPDLKEQNANQKLIEELESYLAKMREDYENEKAKSMTNIASRKSDRDGNTVLATDINEYNLICDIVAMLKNSNKNLISVWGIGSVSADDSKRFKQLVNATKYFSEKIPVPAANARRAKEINKRLAELIKNAKENENAPKIKDGLILESDEREYNLLGELHNYLVLANVAEDLVELEDGVVIDSKHKKRYLEIEAELNKTSKKDIKSDLNKEKIEDVKKQINALVKDAEEELKNNPNAEVKDIAGFKILAKDEPKFKNLIKMGQILKNAQKSNKLVDLGDGTMVDEADLEKYEKNQKELRKQLIETLKKVQEKRETEVEMIPENQAKIKELEERLAKLNGNEEEAKLLNGLIDILKKAKRSDKLIEKDGVKIREDDQLPYGLIMNSLSNLEIPEPKKKAKRHKFSLRQMKDNAKEFMKKNWRKIVCGGLCFGLAAVSAYHTLTFSANSLVGYLPNLINLGAFAASVAVGNKVLRMQNENRLPDPKVKNKKEISKEINGEILNNLTNNITQTELLSAKMEYDTNNIEKEEELGDFEELGLTEEDLKELGIVNEGETVEPKPEKTSEAEEEIDEEISDNLANNITQTDLINAQIEYDSRNVKKEEELGNYDELGLMEEDVKELGIVNEGETVEPKPIVEDSAEQISKDIAAQQTEEPEMLGSEPTIEVPNDEDLDKLLKENAAASNNGEPIVSGAAKPVEPVAPAPINSQLENMKINLINQMNKLYAEFSKGNKSKESELTANLEYYKRNLKPGAMGEIPAIEEIITKYNELKNDVKNIEPAVVEQTPQDSAEVEILSPIVTPKYPRSEILSQPQIDELISDFNSLQDVNVPLQPGVMKQEEVEEKMRKTASEAEGAILSKEDIFKMMMQPPSEGVSVPATGEIDGRINELGGSPTRERLESDIARLQREVDAGNLAAKPELERLQALLVEPPHIGKY